MDGDLGWQLEKSRGARHAKTAKGSGELGLELGRHSTDLQVLGGQPVITVHLQGQVTAFLVSLLLLGGLGTLQIGSYLIPDALQFVDQAASCRDICGNTHVIQR